MEKNEAFTAEQARETAFSVSKTLENILNRIRSVAEEGQYTCPYNSESVTSIIRHQLMKLGYDVRESEPTPDEYVWIDWSSDSENE